MLKIIDRKKQEFFDPKKQTFSQMMTNYFSIGMDARIAYGFDKRRGQSKIQNNLIYIEESMKKNFLDNKNVSEIFEYMLDYA